MSYANGPKIVTDGLVLCLDAANRKSYPGSGSTWYDLSGNGYNGTIQGPTFSNNAFNFDGTDDYIDLSTYASSLIFDAPATINIWLKPTSALSVSNLVFFIGNGVSDATTDNVDSFSIRYGNTTGTLTNERFGLVKAVDHQSPEVRSALNIDGVLDGDTFQNTWVNVCVTLQTNSWQLYTNTISNTLTSSSYWNGTYYGYGDNISEKVAVAIGASKVNDGGSGGYFNGSITAISLYNRLLSSTERETLYNALKGRYGLT